MTIERRDPIPAGRYWVDLVGKEAGISFDIWRRMYPSISVEETEGDTTVDPFQAFVIFTLSKPTERWSKTPGLGYPNTAGPEIHSKADAYRVPVVENPLDALVSMLQQPGTLIVLGIVLYLATQKRS